MLLHKLIDFAVDYFTNLTPRKVVAGMMLLIGLFLTMQVRVVNSVDRAMVYGLAGIFIGGIGVVIIMYESVKEKHFSNLDVVAKGYDNKKPAKGIDAWHMQGTSTEVQSKKDQN